LGVSREEWLANLTHDRKVVGLNLVSSKILDGNGVKTMAGSIPAPNSGSFENKKDKWVKLKNIFSFKQYLLSVRNILVLKYLV